MPPPRLMQQPQKLIGWENLEAWRQSIVKQLVFYDLTHFIKSDSGESEKEEDAKQWQCDRAHAKFIILSSLIPGIRAELRSIGFDEMGADDAEEIYDQVQDAVYKAAKPVVQIKTMELATTRPDETCNWVTF